MMCSLFLNREDETTRPAGLTRPGRALLQRDAARLRPRAALGVPPPVPDAAVHAALIVLTGYLYIVDPEGVLSRSRTPASSSARWRRARMPRSPRWRRSRTRSSRSSCRTRRCQGVVGFAGATGGNPSENTARMFIQLKPFDERDVRAGRSSSGCGRRSPGCSGAKFFMQAGQDITIGGAPEQAAIPVHADRHQPRRAQPLGADLARARCAELPNLHDVASDQQIAAPHIAIDGRSRRRLAARTVDRIDRRRRCTTRSARRRSRRSTPSTQQY